MSDLSCLLSMEKKKIPPPTFLIGKSVCVFPPPRQMTFIILLFSGPSLTLFPFRCCYPFSGDLEGLEGGCAHHATLRANEWNGRKGNRQKGESCQTGESEFERGREGEGEGEGSGQMEDSRQIEKKRTRGFLFGFPFALPSSRLLPLPSLTRIAPRF